MRRFALAAAAWLVCPTAWAGEERPKPAPPAEAREHEGEQKIREALQKRVTFDFVNTPLADVMNFFHALTNVNLIVGPGIDRDQEVTLRVNEMPLGQALQWIARLVGGRVDIRDGAVVIEPDRPGERGPGPTGMPAPPMPFPPGRPFAKATLALSPGLSIEVELAEDDLRPEVRQLLLFLIHRQVMAEAQKHDPKAIQEFMEGMAKRRQMEAEMRRRAEDELRKAEAAKREAEAERRRAEEEARKQRERREKPEGAGDQRKGQF